MRVGKQMPGRSSRQSSQGKKSTPKTELRYLSREQLLKLLLESEEDNDRLRSENAELREQLEERILDIEKCGSLAQAALSLNGVFEAAEEACHQYVQNIRHRADAMLQETEEKCRRMEEEYAPGRGSREREENLLVQETERSRSRDRERTSAQWKDRR